MDLAHYLKNKGLSTSKSQSYRDFCFNCRLAKINCYCDQLQSFHSFPKIVILMHPGEMKKKIATGMITHRSLKNSELFIGKSFGEHQSFNQLIQDQNYNPILLFPKHNSQNIQSYATKLQENQSLTKTPLVILLDGTWRWAKNIYNHSPNLHKLPCYHFERSDTSYFLVRKQPADHCFATIEAAHHIISIFNPQQSTAPQDNMLRIFHRMVESYLKYFPKNNL